ncbi:MMPL family transporter [Paenarthrobacter histidinolovorans]|uniref:MMPL family transporter n=1 Tax=Paenarthrobacter histidinolovorans TaxID=43664 RepID=UPI001663A031|nr:MMPL family transporter [Paenarthrobacter histidinolovorans]GGJ22177.1 membrane protein [Paenarthrobacter histidinolovorans]
MALFLARIGRLAGRHRIATIAAWLAVLVSLVAVALGGMKFSEDTFDVPGTESSKAMSLLERHFPSGSEEGSGSLQLVVQTPSGDLITAPGPSSEMAKAIQYLRVLPNIEKVLDPLDPQHPYISADRSTAVVQLTISGMSEADRETIQERVEDVAVSLREEGLTAEVGGSLAPAVPDILGPSEIVGAGLAFVVLVLTFGSLVAAGANMLSALVGVATGIVGILAFSAVSPIGSVTPILAVMLGLAVGIDYCLFILARFRSELRDGHEVEAAIGRATGAAGSSVVFAGATVIIALAGLSVVGIPFIAEMGVAAAFAVGVAVLMSLTLLPALMAFMGRRALSRRERQRGGSGAHETPRIGRGFLAGWAKFVVRRRVLSLCGGALVLAVVAIPLLSMKTTLAVPGGEDPKSSQRAAYQIVSDKFGAGAQDPLVVLVESTTGSVAKRLPEVQELLARLDNVAAAMPVGSSSGGDAAIISVIAKSGALDDRTTDLVKDIRSKGQSLTGITLSVTGATAIGLDADAQLRQALGLYVALIVGLSLILMIILFRSLLVPVIATAGFLLSLGAGLGATTAVFQWGWLDAVVNAPQGNPLLSLLPIIVTGILFGLAMDYQVFLVSRIHEAYNKGLSPREAIVSGFSKSAIIVVAAAAIMAAVFGGFALSNSSLVGSIALGLAVGVLADAFIVRMIIVPAALALLGDAAWWLPESLKRRLPALDVEGHALDETDRRTDPLKPSAARDDVLSGSRG